MGKIKLIVAVVLIVTLLAGAFYFLDFLVAQSEGRTESSVSAYSSQSAHDMLRAQPGRKLTVFVDARDPIAGALGRELQKDLAQSGVFGEVELQPEPGASAAGDVLRVDVESVDMLWSGVYSHAQVKATMAFSTNGDVSWSVQQRGQSYSRFYSADPAVMIRGSYTMGDSTRGLVSRNGYDAHLGKALAAEIGKSLAAELSRQAQQGT